MVAGRKDLVENISSADTDVNGTRNSQLCCGDRGVVEA